MNLDDVDRKVGKVEILLQRFQLLLAAWRFSRSDEFALPDELKKSKDTTIPRFPTRIVPPDLNGSRE